MWTAGGLGSSSSTASGRFAAQVCTGRRLARRLQAAVPPRAGRHLRTGADTAPLPARAGTAELSCGCRALSAACRSRVVVARVKAAAVAPGPEDAAKAVALSAAALAAALAAAEAVETVAAAATAEHKSLGDATMDRAHGANIRRKCLLRRQECCIDQRCQRPRKPRHLGTCTRHPTCQCQERSQPPYSSLAARWWSRTALPDTRSP